jgi:hypothetical protein
LYLAAATRRNRPASAPAIVRADRSC